MQTLKKILSKNEDKSKWVTQFGFGLAIFILFWGIQIKKEFASIENASKSDNGAFLTVNKEIGILNTLNIGNSDFDDAIIEEIKQEENVLDVAGFKANLYKVTASSKKIYFRTELYFESVPNRFIDCDTSDFEWKEGEDEVPIIISNNFYNLYNFGFAASQNLPKVSKDLLTKFQVDLKLSGPKGTLMLKGRVVGFSDRVNSILVPANFLSHTNKHLAGREKEEYTRLMLQLENINDPSVHQLLRKYDLNTNEEFLLGRTIGNVVDVLFYSLTFISLTILILALVSIVMALKLDLAQNKTALKQLRLLGYSENALVMVEFKKFVSLLSIQFVLATLLFNVLHPFWIDFIVSKGVYIGSTVWMVNFLMFVLVMGIGAISYLSLKRFVSKLLVNSTF